MLHRIHGHIAGRIAQCLPTRIILSMFCIGFGLLLSPRTSSAQTSPAPAAGDSQTISPVIMTGKAAGSMKITNGQYELKASVQELGDYTENWVLPAAVLDYRLPEAVPFSKDITRLGMQFTNPPTNTGYSFIYMRMLIRDARGHEYAVGTRLGSNRSRLNRAEFPTALHSYDWTTNEIGRIDPWVMMRVKPATLDYYDQPQLPMSWIGFRVILVDVNDKPLTVTISDVEPLAAAQKADPYWDIAPDTAWAYHMGKRNVRHQRFGWGPGEPGPYLKASDLGLKDGPTQINWELLSHDDSKVIASDSYSATLDKNTPIQLPLLTAGTYPLKLYAIDAAGKIEPRHLQLVVIRNSRGAPTMPTNKPLSSTTSNGTTVFQDAQGATATIEAKVEGTIEWSLETSDRQPIAKGTGPTVPLGEHFPQHRVLWMTAQLKQDGKIVDQIDRMYGLASPEPKLADASAPAKMKIDRLAGKLLRAKGDWAEGSTPVVSESPKILLEHEAWLNEAADTGYNIVELSAPWVDLNPLPGVYQFEYLDKLVALAEQRGLQVTLRFHPIMGQVPPFVAREFMQDQNGFAHGIWGGGDGMLTSPASEAYRKYSNDFLHALDSHYRDNPALLGYTIESIFFDHDMIDMPWLGQYIDYSEAMRHGFIGWLKEKYTDLAGLNNAWNTKLVHWEQVQLPAVKVQFDDTGRPMPSKSPIFRDWSDYKVASITDLRVGWMKATRAVDPGAFLGIYVSESFEFYIDQIKEMEADITYGSMEGQFPPRVRPGVRGRFEPHAKIARTSQLIDVGMTNMFMIGTPGEYGFFNYWPTDGVLAKQSEPVKEAEARQKIWYGFVDELVKAKPLDDATEARSPAFITEYYTLLYEYGHMFKNRLEDYLRPFNHQLDVTEKQVDTLAVNDVNPETLKNRPYVYIPDASDILTKESVNELTTYVKNGGTLVVEGGSGKWPLNGDEVDVLATALGLGHWQATPASESNEGQWQGITVKLRTTHWDPPITHQPSEWIHNISAAYLKRGTWTGGDAGKTLVADTQGKPILTQHTIGQGKVLAFHGVIDWINSPGLLQTIENFATGQTGTAAKKEQLELIDRQFVNGDVNYLVGRRFIDQAQITAIKSADKEHAVVFESVALHPTLTGLDEAATYDVTDMLEGQKFEPLKGDALMGKGIELQLKPGQAYVLKFEKAK